MIRIISKVDGAILTLRVAAFLLLLPLILRLRLESLSALVSRPPRLARRWNEESILQCCQSVFNRMKPFVRTDCLGRGLTLLYFMRAVNPGFRLVFGIGSVKGKMAGHCWLTRDGEPFLEKGDQWQVFKEIYSI